MEKSSLSTALSIALNKWQRLSPFSVVYFYVQNLFNFARAAFYALPALALNLDNVRSHIDIVIAVLATLALLMLIWSIATYLKFSFKLTNDNLVIRSGVFRRHTLDLPFHRIQSVRIVEPFFFRISHHAVATLDSAGSAQQEAVLAALTVSDALALKNHVMQLSTAGDEKDTESSDASNVHTVLNTRRLSDLIIHGITNNRVWLALGAMAPFFDDIITYADQWLTAQGLKLEQLVGDQAVAWWQLSLYAITLTVIIGFVVALLSVLGAILTFHNYTLVKNGDRYVRKSGLLSVHEVSMQHRRLQVVKMKQDWLDYILKRVNFYYVQNKTGAASAPADSFHHQILVPSVTTIEAEKLLSEAMPSSRVAEMVFKPVSHHYLINRLLIRALPIFLLLGVISLFADSSSPLLLTVLAYAIVSVGIYLRWRRWGIAYDARYLYVKSGIIGQTVQCIELYKLQQISLKQSVFMRRNNVMTVVFVNASGAIVVPFLEYELAKTISQINLDATLSTRKSWM